MSDVRIILAWPVYLVCVIFYVIGRFFGFVGDKIKGEDLSDMLYG